LNQIAKSLGKKFTLSKEVTELPEDIEIEMFVTIERVQDYEAKICILTEHPEECCIFIYSIRSLPRNIEEKFGIVQSIYGQPREYWIYPLDRTLKYQTQTSENRT
jgi:hypothetical protein